MEATNYYNCGNKVNMVVENVRLWQPHWGCEGCRGGGGIAATTWSGTISSLKSGPLGVGMGTERRGHHGASWTTSSQVDLASAGELGWAAKKKWNKLCRLISRHTWSGWISSCWPLLAVVGQPSCLTGYGRPRRRHFSPPSSSSPSPLPYNSQAAFYLHLLQRIHTPRGGEAVVHGWVVKISPHHLQGGGARSWVDTGPHSSMEGRDQGGGGLDIPSCSVHPQTIQESKRHPTTFKLEGGRMTWCYSFASWSPGSVNTYIINKGEQQQNVLTIHFARCWGDVEVAMIY